MSRGEGSLPAGVPTPAIRREIPFLVGTAGIMLLLFGYYAYTCLSPSPSSPGASCGDQRRLGQATPGYLRARTDRQAERTARARQ